MLIYVADLTPYLDAHDDGMFVQYEKHLRPLFGRSRCVGWLDRGRPYPRGEVPEEVVARLLRLGEYAWLQHRGHHNCPFCPPLPDPGPYAMASECMTAESLGDLTFHLGSRVAFIPSPEGGFAFPDLIAHYVRRHGYRPPEALLDAVMALEERDIPDPFEIKPLLRREAQAVIAAREGLEPGRTERLVRGPSGREYTFGVLTQVEEGKPYMGDPPEVLYLLLSVEPVHNPLHLDHERDAVYLYPDGRSEWSEERSARFMVLLREKMRERGEAG